jgi:hypothetical protein
MAQDKDVVTIYYTGVVPDIESKGSIVSPTKVQAEEIIKAINSGTTNLIAIAEKQGRVESINNYVSNLVEYEISKLTKLEKTFVWFNWQINNIKYYASSILSTKSMSDERVITYDAFLKESQKKLILEKVSERGIYVKDARYTDYKAWIAEHYQIEGENTQAHVANILSQNRPVYLLLPTVTPYWQDVFTTEPYNELFAVIKGVK